MPRWTGSVALATLGIAAVAGLTSAFLPVLGLTASALLFLLPVLATAARGGTAPAVFAALLATVAYNFFLLPPRFTFRILGLENFVGALVLLAVALVTSRLATRLKAREAEALDRAAQSRELAELSAILGSQPAATALARGIAFLAGRHGAFQLVTPSNDNKPDAAFSSVDLAAAAWALHQADITGHGTEVMPAADWTFLPLGPGTATDGAVAALARPDDGRLRTQDELAHLAEAARLIGQARDREELEGERRAREGLVETDRLRQTLLAALAHDFRTPLTVLIGRLAGLAATSPDAAEALGAARRLDRMMADLLGAARLEAGALEPRIERIDLVDAVAGAIEATRSADSPVIRNSLAPDLPLVPADPLLLHHLLVNLLDNAQRHARTRVQVEARATDGRVILAVADDGPGIPLADRDRLFDRFTRLEGSDRTGGSGLGLAIVKGFAEAMDMQVTLTEAEGGGARFELAFP